MRAIFKDGLLILRPEDAGERADLDAWKAARQGHVLLVRRQAGVGLALGDLGPQPIACREPINVISTHREEQIRILSNFALTPFVLGGRPYQSVEGFWQGLKFDDPAERRRLAQLDGKAAKRAGRDGVKSDVFAYEGRQYRVGSHEHWDLMRAACWAKFTQHLPARAALLATHPRPLIHRVRRDSRTIPGVIMADIWMRIRDKLAAADDPT